MTGKRPPVLATWILKHVARGNEALIGDLLEEHRRRRSAAWYWRQVVTAVVVGRSRAAMLSLGVVALYGLGSYFSIPGANASLRALVERAAVGTPWRVFSVFAGGQLTGVTIFALGISPYISAAFLVQAVTLVWRFLSRNAEKRRRLPLVMCTWSVAILLCATQAAGLAMFLERASVSGPGLPLVLQPGWMFRMTTLLTLTAGTTCLMLISDQISKRGLGNGMFIVFVAGIVAALPGIAAPLLAGEIDPFAVFAMLALNTAIAGVVSHGYRRAIEDAVSGGRLAADS